MWTGSPGACGEQTVLTIYRQGSRALPNPSIRTNVEFHAGEQLVRVQQRLGRMTRTLYLEEQA
jgi:hypothetical protein